VSRLERAFRVRHHAEHIALRIDDPRDAACRAIDLAGVAEGDPALRFQAIERFRIGLVIAVVVGDREC
jgi:hypothetical protein